MYTQHDETDEHDTHIEQALRYDDAATFVRAMEEAMPDDVREIVGACLSLHELRQRLVSNFTKSDEELRIRKHQFRTALGTVRALVERCADAV